MAQPEAGTEAASDAAVYAEIAPYHQSWLGLRRYLRQRKLQMPPAMTGLWVALGTALIVVLLVGGCSSREAPAAPPKPHVSAANPIVREVIDWDDYVGRFEAVQDVTVMPRVSGTITEILFRNGQDVKAGQPLFIIDPRPFRAVHLQAVADLAKARATQANASTVFARAQKLLSAQVLSKEDYDNREAALHAADADVDAQTAAVEAARLRPC